MSNNGTGANRVPVTPTKPGGSKEAASSAEVHWADDLPEGQPPQPKLLTRTGNVKERMDATDSLLENFAGEQFLVNQNNTKYWCEAKHEFLRVQKSIILMEKDSAAKACVLRGLATREPPKQVKQKGGKLVWQCRELPHETLLLIRQEVISRMDIQEPVMIESATRFPQNPNNNKPSGIRIKFHSPEDKYLVFSNLKNLRNHAESRGWHFCADYPPFLSQQVRRAEMQATEYRLRNTDKNTSVSIQKDMAIVMQKNRKEKKARWIPVPKAEIEAINKALAKGTAMMQNRAPEPGGVQMGAVNITPNKPLLNDKQNNINLQTPGIGAQSGPSTSRGAIRNLRPDLEKALNDEEDEMETF